MAARKKKGAVATAVEKDLKQLRLEKSGLGEAALVLARKLDAPDIEAAPAATAARALVRTYEKVRELTPSSERPGAKPPEKEADGVTNIRAARTARRRRSAKP